MRRITNIILTVVFIGSSLVSSADSGETASKSQTKEGYHCLFIGHSFFAPVVRRFKKLPGQSGIENHRQEQLNRGGRGGSPGGLWTRPVTREAIQNIIETGKIELLGMPYKHYFDGSMQDYTLNDYKRWIDYALKYNTETVFFLGLPWGRYGADRELTEYVSANEQASNVMYYTFS